MPKIQMRHWKARTTFGGDIVDHVISNPRWQKQYPKLYKQLESSDKFKAILPEPMVLEMAKDGIYYYRADEDGERLYCHGYKGEPKARIGRFLSTFEAIQEYGSECVFEATDKSVGYKWQDDAFGDD